MPEPAPTPVRKATRADIDAIADALVKAFSDDPVMDYFFPEKLPRRLERLRAFFKLNLKSLSLRHGEVYTTEDGVHGAAIWMPPGKWKTTTADIVRTLPATVRMLGRQLPFALRGLTFMESHHPKEPAFYLQVLGTEPEVQGKGIGSAMLQPVLARCDREGVGAYLESSKDRNVPFYSRHGFTVTDEVRLPAGGPPVWLMWRDPRPSGG